MNFYFFSVSRINKNKLNFTMYSEYNLDEEPYMS